ncbi:unnamed protein product, partial [Ectocarpus sp. 12 AP-2014]
MDRASTVAGFIAVSLYCVRSGAYSTTTTYDDSYPSSSPSYYVNYPSVYSSTSSDCFGVFVSDGWCDLENNNAECDWDGGDCCQCTCLDSRYECGVNGFSCLDPSA